MNLEKLLNEKEAAVVLGMSVKTLQSWRFYSKGPKYRKLLNRAVRYSMADLQEFIDASAVEPLA